MKKIVLILWFLFLSKFLFSRSAVICNGAKFWKFPNLPIEDYFISQYNYYLPKEGVNFPSNLSDNFISDLLNSKLLYFGQINVNEDLLFLNEKYKEAVKKFLENGGTIIFDNHLPSGETKKFFESIGVFIPEVGAIPNVSGDSVYPVISTEEKEKNHPILNFPYKLEENKELNGCLIFKKWSENQIAPLRASADPNFAVMVIQENVCGKGKIIFNGIRRLYGHHRRGEIYASNIYSYVYGEEIKRIPTADKRYRTKKEYEIWYKTPYSKFPFEEDAPEKNRIDKVDMKACINEVIGTNILITNGKKGDLRFKVEMGEIKDEKRNIKIPEDRIKVMELEFDGSRMPDRMPERKEFVIGEGKTGIIWINLNTNDLKEGDYSGDIVLVFEDGGERKVRLNIKIYPIELQKTNPIKLTVWDLVPGGVGRDNMIKGAENWIKYHQDMREHGVNVFHLSAYERPGITFDEEGEIVKEDYTRFDSGIPFKEKEYQYLINMGSHTEEFRIEGKKETVKYGTELWEKCYKNWVKSIIKHMKSIGFDYNQFAFYPYDEIGTQTVPDALKIYSLIKEVDKKARIFVTIVPNGFFEAQKGLPVKEIAPYIDIWCPAFSHENYFSAGWPSKKEFDRILEFLKNTGKEIWSYNVLTRGNAEIMAYKRYRLQPLSAYRMGIGGCGFYGYNLWKNDTYMVVYPDENPITSYRWEAMREGINDLKYIECLKKEMKKIKDEKKKKECEDLINEFLKEVTENNETPDLIYNYREKIVAKILELKK